MRLITITASSYYFIILLHTLLLYNGVYFPRILTLHRLELPAAGELFVEEEHAVEDEHDGACNTSDD